MIKKVKEKKKLIKVKDCKHYRRKMDQALVLNNKIIWTITKALMTRTKKNWSIPEFSNATLKM